MAEQFVKKWGVPRAEEPDKSPQGSETQPPRQEVSNVGQKSEQLQNEVTRLQTELAESQRRFSEAQRQLDAAKLEIARATLKPGPETNTQPENSESNLEPEQSLRSTIESIKVLAKDNPTILERTRMDAESLLAFTERIRAGSVDLTSVRDQSDIIQKIFIGEGLTSLSLAAESQDSQLGEALGRAGYLVNRIKRDLMNRLKTQGLEPVYGYDGTTKYNPDIHKRIGSGLPTSNLALHNTVQQVLTPGLVLNGQIVRKAQVSVYTNVSG